MKSDAARRKRRRRGFICCPDLKRRHPIRFKVASFSVGRDEKKTDSHTLRRRKFQTPHAENPSRQTSKHTKTSTREKRAPWRTHNFVKAIRIKVKTNSPVSVHSLREPSSCVCFFLSLSLSHSHSLYIIV